MQQCAVLSLFRGQWRLNALARGDRGHTASIDDPARADNKTAAWAWDQMKRKTMKRKNTTTECVSH